jgi:hypothetical protein
VTSESKRLVLTVLEGIDPTYRLRDVSPVWLMLLAAGTALALRRLDPPAAVLSWLPPVVVLVVVVLHAWWRNRWELAWTVLMTVVLLAWTMWVVATGWGWNKLHVAIFIVCAMRLPVAFRRGDFDTLPPARRLVRRLARRVGIRPHRRRRRLPAVERRILKALRDAPAGGVPVDVLAGAAQRSPSATYRHLRRLQDVDLITKVAPGMYRLL